jgi:anti-anti-sigma regulatory factor
MVVALSSQLDATEATQTATVLASVAARGRRVIVDLADLEFNDCTAPHELAPAQQTARADGGDLLLAAPGPVRRHGCCS